MMLTPFLTPPLIHIYRFFTLVFKKKKKKVNESTSNKQWITNGIINSCRWKNDLYLFTRNNNDIQLKEYYMRYSKILAKVIKTAEIFHYNNQITHSNNKIKTMWNIIKSETGGNNIKYDKANVYNIDKEYNKCSCGIFKNLIF